MQKCTKNIQKTQKVYIKTHRNTQRNTNYTKTHTEIHRNIYRNAPKIHRKCTKYTQNHIDPPPHFKLEMDQKQMNLWLNHCWCFRLKNADIKLICLFVVFSTS